jgi:hypothetical protein
MVLNGQTPDRPPFSEGSGVHEAAHAQARVQACGSLPDLLTEAFDAFEVIRLLARSGEEQAPHLLAAFITAADAAVDGREALTIAPSLPTGRSRLAAATVPLADPDPGEVADGLARLATVLAERLTSAAADTTLAGDRAACLEAAQAAQRISQLMARGGDDGHLR